MSLLLAPGLQTVCPEESHPSRCGFNVTPSREFSLMKPSPDGLPSSLVSQRIGHPTLGSLLLSGSSNSDAFRRLETKGVAAPRPVRECSLHSIRPPKPQHHHQAKHIPWREEDPALQTVRDPQQAGVCSSRSVYFHCCLNRACKWPERSEFRRAAPPEPTAFPISCPSGAVSPSVPLSPAVSLPQHPFSHLYLSNHRPPLFKGRSKAVP